jgi:hypothetical protein
MIKHGYLISRRRLHRPVLCALAAAGATMSLAASPAAAVSAAGGAALCTANVSWSANPGTASAYAFYSNLSCSGEAAYAYLTTTVLPSAGIGESPDSPGSYGPASFTYLSLSAGSPCLVGVLSNGAGRGTLDLGGAVAPAAQLQYLDGTTEADELVTGGNSQCTSSQGVATFNLASTAASG